MNSIYKNFLFAVVTICYGLGTFLIVTMPEYSVLYLSMLGIGVLGTVIICFMNKENILSFMNSNYGKNISSNFVGFILLFFILCILNYIAFKRPVVWDLGKRQLNSLTKQSISVVKSIDEDIKFTIFSSRKDRDAIRNLLKLYQLENKNISISYVDPDIRPDLVASHNVTISPSVVVKKAKKSFVVTKIQELNFTNALINVSRKSDPIICFSYSPLFENKSEAGLTGLLHILKNSAFKLQIINLLQVANIPNTCNVFSIWGIKSDFLPENLKKIKSYFNQGGTIITAFSPLFNGDRVSNLRAFYLENGLKISNDITIDQDSSINGSKGSAPIIKIFDSLGINSKLAGQVFLPLTSSVHEQNKPTQFEYVSLATTSGKSWAEKSLTEMLTDEVKFDELDVMGPIDVVSAVTENKRARLIALGNSSMVTNKFYNFQSNYNFVLNLFHWSVGQDMLTSVQAAVFTEKPIFIGPTQKKVIFYFTVIAAPLIFVLIALIQFRRRRVA